MWTNGILRSEEITYLSAFISCIMAEKSRLEALTADRAKLDFKSSVSHEHRSPLHGVLASAEALQETSTGFGQDDLICTITVCGKVLMDTMDQTLEYAKLSHQKYMQTGTEAQVRPEPPPSSKASALDLSRLAETVVEDTLLDIIERLRLTKALFPARIKSRQLHRYF